MHDHKNIIKLLKNAHGQVASTIKMTEDDRYCLDISTQISASIALLKKAQKQLLVNHLNTCVLDSIHAGSPEAKIDEINLLLKKIL